MLSSHKLKRYNEKTLIWSKCRKVIKQKHTESSEKKLRRLHPDYLKSLYRSTTILFWESYRVESVPITKHTYKYFNLQINLYISYKTLGKVLLFFQNLELFLPLQFLSRMDVFLDVNWSINAPNTFWTTRSNVVLPIILQISYKHNPHKKSLITFYQYFRNNYTKLTKIWCKLFISNYFSTHEVLVLSYRSI